MHNLLFIFDPIQNRKGLFCSLYNFIGSQLYQTWKIFITSKDKTICLIQLSKKHTRIYKQMDVSLQVLKFFQVSYRQRINTILDIVSRTVYMRKSTVLLTFENDLFFFLQFYAPLHCALLSTYYTTQNVPYVILTQKTRHVNHISVSQRAHLRDA